MAQHRGGDAAWHRWGLAALLAASGAAHAVQIVVPGPADSRRFGTAVAVLPSGDFVVADPQAAGPGGLTSVGAVHHYRPDGVRVATLRGSRSGDLVGEGGIVVLANGNYLVRSPRWDNGAVVDAGAVTFVRGDTGLDGEVSPANSLVGSTADDRIGFRAPVALGNGNYIVVSPEWNNGVATDAGAVVFGNGTTGITGAITASNALVGASTNDRIGFGGIVRLANGNWLTVNPDFDAGALVDAGAVTLGSAVTGRFGVISAANSLVGASAGDRVGSAEIGILTNGNYVVPVPEWNNGALADAGAVVFGSGTAGVAGPVTTDKALFGSNADDRVGNNGITPLPGGAYLVASPGWRNGSATNAGAVTFGNGSSGIVGAVSASNSLVGTQTNDQIGATAPVVLGNGNWAIGSPFWDNGAVADAGAVTFGFGTSGRTGAVGTNNSLVGSSAGDRVGERLVALTGGNAATIGGYVIVSPQWNNPGGGVDHGAVTVLAGTGGVSGTVLAINSLVGAQAGDRVGSGGAFALPDGRFVVASPFWDNGATIDVGAATLRESTPLVSGVVSTANSLVGARAGDEVGSGGVVALPNSAYLVLSPEFAVGAAAQAGAVTWVPPTTGLVWTVSSTNSMVGSSLLDSVGGGRELVTVLDDGDAVVVSPFWDNGGVRDAGAATYIDRDSGRAGVIGATNSLVGGSVDDIVGFNGVLALPGGDYLVRSRNWSNGAAASAGAVTFGTDSGSSGVVSPANSIVGSTAGDEVGAEILLATNGNFIIRSRNWDNAGLVNAGAFTLGLASGSVLGPLTSEHSVLGTVANGGNQGGADYDPARNQLVVGQPLANRVVLHRPGAPFTCGAAVQTPNPSDVGAAVTFSGFVSGAGTNQYNGAMTVRASNGQQCTDATGTSFGSGQEFSCPIAFNQDGTFGVFVEFTGASAFAYCALATPLPQTVISTIFRNGFE